MRLDRVSATVNSNSILRCSLAFSQNLSKEISDLDPEVARVTDDGIKLVKSENIGGDLEEKLVQDINDIEERYEKLKKSSSDDVKRYCVDIITNLYMSILLTGSCWCYIIVTIECQELVSPSEEFRQIGKDFKAENGLVVKLVRILFYGWDKI